MSEAQDLNAPASGDQDHFEAMKTRRLADAKQKELLEQRQLKLDAPVQPDPWAMDLKDLDPSHPVLFQKGLELEYFRRLREESPVHFHEDGIFGPYWSITKYQDIMEVDKHHEVFSSDLKYGGITLFGTPDTAAEIPMFIQMDQPKHDVQRKAVAPMFTPRNLATLEETIREKAGQILDGLPRGKAFNWVDEVSIELTGQMLAILFDIPQEDRHKLIFWSDTAGGSRKVESQEELWSVFAECGQYFANLWNERVNAEPKFDLISMMAHSEQTRNLTPGELLGNVLLLIVGGNDTTRNSISGGVLALNQFPDEFAKLRARPEQVPNMVSEVIRWQTPLAHMRRTAVKDVEFRGKTIKAGDKVAMWYVSGNRDTSHIPDADQFLIDRPNARQHISFGYGIHRCLGNRLAEMQLKTVWEEILKRFDRVEVVGEPGRVASCFVRGYHDLQVIVE